MTYSVLRILVEKRPPDVAVGTPPQMVSLIGRCAAQLGKVDMADMASGTSGIV